jgi:type IV pilus assembly protein PilM
MLSIDVTDKQLKLVKGSLAGNKIKINDVETRDVPEECIVNGYVVEADPVANVIIKMLADKKISEKEVIVCINSSSILYKELEIPKPKTMKNTTAIEAMIIAQMGISSDYNISYSIVGEGQNEEGAATIKLMATACPQRMVDSYQHLFNKTGLKLKQINVSNNCITRLILNTPKLKEAMPFMCIQVDADFVNINLYEEGQVALSRYIKIDPSDYDDNPDYVNIAVFDNLFRMIQFIGQRPGAKPLRQIMFYGMIKDFVALSNSIMSFNIPAHVLSMPTNIVKFCEVDFSKYANAIGAFYKVDPNLEHINLLESMAVVAKVAGNTLPLKVLTVMGLSAALIFAGYFVLDQWNRGIQRDTRRVETDITNAQFDLKRESMNLMENTRNSFAEFKHRAQLANVLFDFLPRGDLPQIMDELNEVADMVRTDPDFSRGTFYGFDEVRWSGYNISLLVYGSGDDYPADFVDAMHRRGFFEAVGYGGFTSVDETSIPEHIAAVMPSNAPEAREFRLTFKIKGGHIFLDDGTSYTR